MSDDDPAWKPLYDQQYNHDLIVFAEGSNNLGRGFTVCSEHLVTLVPSLSARVAEATAEIGNKMSARAPRTLLSGMHPGTICSSTGKRPISGFLWRRKDEEKSDKDKGKSESCNGDLCSAAFDALSDSEKAAYFEVLPTVFPSCRPSDDDDGTLAITLPGTRRAIKLLLQRLHEMRYDDDYCFADVDEAVHNDLTADDDLLAELLELCDKIGASEAVMEPVHIGLDCLFDQQEASTATVMRIFSVLTKRYPLESTSASPLKQYIGSAAQEALSVAADEAPDLWTFEELLKKRELLDLELPQMARLIDVLPPACLEDGPLLVCEKPLSEIMDLNKPLTVGYVPCQVHLSCDDGSGRPGGEMILMAIRDRDGPAFGKQKETLVSLLWQSPPTGCTQMTLFKDVKLVVTSLDDPAISKQQALARCQFHNSCLMFGVDDAFFTRKAKDGEKAEDASAGTSAAVQVAPAAAVAAAGASAPPPEGAELSSRLKVRTELRRARDERRRAVLSAWACAHGLAEESSSSLLDLLLFYNTKLGAAEQPASSSAPARAASDSSSSAAAAQLRKIIIGDSLAGHIAEPAALRGFVGGEAASRIDAPLLRRLLDARAPPPEESAAGGASTPVTNAVAAGSSSSSSGGGDAGDALMTDSDNGLRGQEPRCAVREEIQLLNALKPWAAAHSPSDILHVLPALYLDLIPLGALRAHVQSEDGILRDASNPSSPLRSALSDALLPGMRHMRVASVDDETPHELTCCITLALMTDPVVAQDGKSYERAAIEAYWRKEGNKPISPITREELKSKDLVPNVNLKTLCAEYASKHKRVRLAAASPQDVVMEALLSPTPPSEGASYSSSSVKRKIDDVDGEKTAPANADGGPAKAGRHRTRTAKAK